MKLETTLSLTVLLILIILLLKFIFRVVVQAYYVQKLPGPPRSNFLLGNTWHLHGTPEHLFQTLVKLNKKYKTVFKIWVGFFVCVNTACPEEIGLVLANPKHHRKSYFYEILRKWLQTGLITTEGDKWIRRRKILTPAFHFTILQDFVATFNERADELIQTLKKDEDKPYTEVTDLVTAFALKVITETAIGKRLNLDNNKEIMYEKAIHDIGKIAVYRCIRPYLLGKAIYIFTRTYFKEWETVKILQNFTKQVIAEREKEYHGDISDTTKRKRLAMLDLLLTVKKEKRIDDVGIREEVDTFMFAGHDTISKSICFGLMLLAYHQDIQENILQEMREVLGDIKKKPDYQDLQQLKYMERCIKETLRLYPSVPFLSRKLGEDLVTNSGYKIKKDTTVNMYIYNLHRNPEIYPDPEKFDPDRFLPENCTQRHPYAYIPFSAGPRNCIGQKFAMLEIKSIFCAILGNFVLKPVDTPDTVVLVMDFLLRSKESIKVKFIPRSE